MISDDTNDRVYLIRKTFWIYHVVSAVIGVFLLLAFAYGEIIQKDLKGAFFPLLLVFLYVPFLKATYEFLKANKRAYFCVLFFYAMEVFSISSIYEFKLSLLHYSIVVPIVNLPVGVDIISLGIFVSLLLMRRKF